MLPGTTQNTDQLITDYSGNSNHGINGGTSSLEVTDATLYEWIDNRGSEGFIFTGGNYIFANNLGLSGSGFSIELWCKLDAIQSSSLTYMKLYSNTAESFTFEMQPSINAAKFKNNDAATSSVIPCSTFNSKVVII